MLTILQQACYPPLPHTLPLPLPALLRVGSGVKTDASTALGITDTTSGFRPALRTVFSLLNKQQVCIMRKERTNVH